MRKLVFVFFLLISIQVVCAQMRSGEHYGMKANDVEFDNAQAFQAAIADHKNGNLTTLQLNGLYNFNTTVNLDETNGLLITNKGDKKAVLFSKTLYSIIVNRKPSKNISFKNIKFESVVHTNPDDLKGHDNALLYIARETNTFAWRIENCEFTAPNAPINGIKIYVLDGNMVSDISIRNSYFHDLGRMGAETVNHDKPLKTARISNVIFEGNRVERTGLVISGMGISLSGRNTDCLIQHNIFKDNPNCAIEIAGNMNTDILNNTMHGSGSAVHIVDGPGMFNSDIYMQCNTADVIEGNVYINAVQILNENNSWTSKTKNYIKGVDNFVTNNDHIKTSKTAVFQIFGSAVRPTHNIRFENSILEAQKNIPIVSYTKSGGPVSNVTINCSEVKIPTGKNFGAIVYGNTKCFVNI